MLNQVVTAKFTTINNGVLTEHIKLNDDVASGSYFVRVMVGDKIYTGRIIYQKQE